MPTDESNEFLFYSSIKTAEFYRTHLPRSMETRDIQIDLDLQVFEFIENSIRPAIAFGLWYFPDRTSISQRIPCYLLSDKFLLEVKKFLEPLGFTVTEGEADRSGHPTVVVSWSEN